MGDIITRDDLVAHLRIGNGNLGRLDPDVLDTCIRSAERTIRMATGRSFTPDPPPDGSGGDTGDPVAKTFKVRRRNQTMVRLPDLREATEVRLDDNVLTEDVHFDFDLYAGDEPITSISLQSWYLYFSPFVQGFALRTTSTLTITGRWGFWPPPDDVREIALQIAGRKYFKRDAQFADQVEISTDQGGNTRDYRAGLTQEQDQTLARYRVVQVGLV